MTSTMDSPSGLRQAFDPLLRSSSKSVGMPNISRVSEKRVTQMKNAGIWTAYDSSQLSTVYLGRVFLRGRKRHQTGGAVSFTIILFDRYQSINQSINQSIKHLLFAQ